MAGPFGPLRLLFFWGESDRRHGLPIPACPRSVRASSGFHPPSRASRIRRASLEIVFLLPLGLVLFVVFSSNYGESGTPAISRLCAPWTRLLLLRRASRLWCSNLAPENALKSAVRHGPDSTLLNVLLDMEYPSTTDIVTTHYVGTIVSDGSTFGSSLVRSVLGFCFPSPLPPDSALALACRGTPFVTEIGVGKAIKGWDEGGDIHLVGRSVTLLMTADMIRCPTTDAGIQGNIESFARLCACHVRDCGIEQHFTFILFRRTALGAFHQSFRQTLPSNSKWSSLKLNLHRDFRGMRV
jgi:hypothetical protein